MAKLTKQTTVDLGKVSVTIEFKDCQKQAEVTEKITKAIREILRDLR